MEISKNENLWAGVEAAHNKNKSLCDAPAQACAPSVDTAPAFSEIAAYPAPVAAPAVDLKELRSALTVLDPDCPEKTWAAHRIGALANAAREHPELDEELFALAVDWSSGKLRCRPASTWAKAGSHGRARLIRLHTVWDHFRKAPFEGRRVTLATVFFHAREAGWTQAGDA